MKSTCKTWVHYSCEKVDNADRKQWSKISLGYICVRCRSNEDDIFDFLMGAERLKQAAKNGAKKLNTAVEREVLFLRNVTMSSTLHTQFNDHEQDTVANYILSRYHSSSKSAILSTGDGDCLFNAVSTCICGDESMSVELRYRCCVEMVSNGDKIRRNRMYPRLELISPDYYKDCVECAKPGSYSSVWRLIALSNLLNIPIESVYPSINGAKHIAFRSLNATFRPPFADPDNGNITIMWTNTTLPETNAFQVKSSKVKREWYPNHFVPLVDVKRNASLNATYNNSGMKSECTPTKPVSVKQEYVSPNRFESLVVEDCSLPDHDTENVIEMPEEQLDNNDVMNDKHVPDLSTIMEESVIEQPVIEMNISETDTESDDMSNVNHTENHVPMETEQTVTDNSHNDSVEAQNDSEYAFLPGPLGNKFMDMKDTMNIFRGPYTILEEIPTGRKDGFYFIVSNAENVERRNAGKRTTSYFV